MFRPTTLVFGLAFVVVGCGGGGTDEDDAPGAVADRVEVQIQAIDNTFRPEAATVEPGTELVFSNGGRNDHNVLPADGGDEWGVATEDFGPGDEYRVVLTEPGTYPYYCSLHATPTAGMIGTIEVAASGS
ncbi:MAG: plastocyanin/azurin family copper-binding protein [Acidimicrobiia bacterium]|nr:plastocyanin/azurin family copper-binding protein [Acidimicrobiia bacterium]